MSGLRMSCWLRLKSRIEGMKRSTREGIRRYIRQRRIRPITRYSKGRRRVHFQGWN